MSDYKERILSFFQKKYSRWPVKILKSSEDPEIERYLASVPAEASASMVDGELFLLLRDNKAGRAALYEEISHLIQFIKSGQLPIGNSKERLEREIEVAQCLLDRRKRLYLTQGEVIQTEINLQVYKQKLLGAV